MEESCRIRFDPWLFYHHNTLFNPFGVVVLGVLSLFHRIASGGIQVAPCQGCAGFRSLTSGPPAIYSAKIRLTQYPLKCSNPIGFVMLNSAADSGNKVIYTVNRLYHHFSAFSDGNNSLIIMTSVTVIDKKL